MPLQGQAPSEEPAEAQMATSVPSDTAAPTATETPAPSPTPTETPSPTPSITPSPSVTPVYTPIRGHAVGQTNCRYGPGGGYLYKYGLYENYVVWIEGRDETATWAYVQALGFEDQCWVKGELIKFDGDLALVPYVEHKLPLTKYYQAPTGVHAKREGDLVVVSWNDIGMTEDKYRGYLIEAWVCRAGEIVFTPVWVDGTIKDILDEPGCAEESHGRLYGAEKHGYTRWVMIPWPQHPGTAGSQ